MLGVKIKEVPLRFSPHRSTIYFAKPIPTTNENSLQSMVDLIQTVNDVAPIKEGEGSEAKKPKVTDDGFPILEVNSCTIPDPRFSDRGHLCFGIYFYTCFLLAIGYAIWRFVDYEVEVSVSMPLTKGLGLQIPLSLGIFCQQPTTLTFFRNYSSSSPCYTGGNAMITSINVSGGELNFFDASLCHSFQDAFIFTDVLPALAGLAVKFDSVPWGSLCTINITATMFANYAASNSTVSVLSVEGGFVKTFYMAYTVTNIKQEEGRVESTSLDAQYYELDGVRVLNAIEWGKSGADSSSIVAFRLSDVSRKVTKFDFRNGFKFMGFYGQVWGMVGKSMIILVPMFALLYPRNFMEDAKAGKIDGYTRFLLDDAWKPATLVGFSLDVMTRVKQVMKDRN